MPDSTEAIALLQEIRDLQREYLEIYRKHVADSEAELSRTRKLQEEILARSRANSVLYRTVLAVAAAALAFAYFQSIG